MSLVVEVKPPAEFAAASLTEPIDRKFSDSLDFAVTGQTNILVRLRAILEKPFGQFLLSLYGRFLPSPSMAGISPQLSHWHSHPSLWWDT